MADAITSDTIEERIRSLCHERGSGKTVCPSEVARDLAGSDEKRWRLLMAPIRAQAVRLAIDGAIVIRRKGRIVDPVAFKGIYRLGLPPEA